MVSIWKFRIIVLVSNPIKYWSNYLIRFEISNILTALMFTALMLLGQWQEWRLSQPYILENLQWPGVSLEKSVQLNRNQRISNSQSSSSSILTAQTTAFELNLWTQIFFQDLKNESHG